MPWGPWCSGQGEREEMKKGRIEGENKCVFVSVVRRVGKKCRKERSLKVEETFEKKVIDIQFFLPENKRGFYKLSKAPSLGLRAPSTRLLLKI